jgi:hypothetical protein
MTAQQPNFTGMILGSSAKVVQMVSVFCISRSQGQKRILKNAKLKNLLVGKYKA